MKQIPGVGDAVVIALSVGKGRKTSWLPLSATDLNALQLRRHICAVSESYAVPKRMVGRESHPHDRYGQI